MGRHPARSAPAQPEDRDGEKRGRPFSQAADGALRLSVRDQLRLWLAELENAAQEPSSTGILMVEGTALLRPVER